MRKFSMMILLLTTACADMNQAQPMNNGIHQITDYGFMGGAGTVVTRAATTCTNEGNKKLVIVGNTMQVGITGTQYPLLIFRCE